MGDSLCRQGPATTVTTPHITIPPSAPRHDSAWQDLMHRPSRCVRAWKGRIGLQGDVEGRFQRSDLGVLFRTALLGPVGSLLEWAERTRREERKPWPMIITYLSVYEGSTVWDTVNICFDFHNTFTDKQRRQSSPAPLTEQI